MFFDFALCSEMEASGVKWHRKELRFFSGISIQEFWKMWQSTPRCINAWTVLDTRADPYLSGTKFPSNHLKLERSPGVMILSHACGVVTVAQSSSRRCRYDPHFPPLYTFITRSFFSCCWYNGKFTSNWGAEVSRIKKHLKQNDRSYRFLMLLCFYILQLHHLTWITRM